MHLVVAVVGTYSEVAAVAVDLVADNLLYSVAVHIEEVVDRRDSADKKAAVPDLI